MFKRAFYWSAFSALVLGSARADEVKPYPLDTCIVSGDKLRKSISIVYEGRELRFCCRECKWEFKDTPEKYLKQLESSR